MAAFPLNALAQEVQGIGAVSGLLPPAVGTSAKDSAALSLSRFDNATGTQSDVVIGRGLKGPYLLTWKGIRPNSEVVLRDGIALKPEVDYTLDAASGALAFPTPLQPNQLIRITYRADQPDSVLNKKTFALPVQLDLWHSGSNRLAFQSLYQPDANKPGAKGDTSSLLSSLQFNGGLRLAKGSDLSSSLMVDLRGGDWLGRSGLRFSERTQGKQGEFGLTYSRAGAKFAQENANGLTAGREIMEATGSLAPASGLKLNGTLRQTTELRNTDSDKPGDNQGPIGSVTRELGQNLIFTLPKSKGSLEAGRIQTVVTQTDGSGVTRTQDTIKAQETLRKGTQATVTYEALTSAPFAAKKEDSSQDSDASKGDYSQKTTLELKHSPSDQLKVIGTFQNVLGGATAGDAESFKVEALPFAKMRQLKIIANWEDRYKADGATRSREASVELPALAWWRLQTSGGLRQSSSPGKERLVGIVNAKSRPHRYLELSGGARLRDGFSGGVGNPDPDAVNTYLIKLAVEPSKQFRFTGNLTRNPEADDGTIRKTQKQDVGLETKIGVLSLRGQYGTEEEYLQSRQTNTLDLGLDLRLTSADTLSGGFQGRFLLDKDDSSTRTFSLAYTHRLGSLFDLSLTGTMSRYSLNGVNAPDKEEIKAQAKLGLKF